VIAESSVVAKDMITVYDLVKDIPFELGLLDKVDINAL
jgi:hypothetical protein